MRTTIHIHDDLIARVKRYAVSHGMTLTHIISDSLTLYLARAQENKGKKRPTRLTTFRGKGLLPGVDLDDSAALLETMDKEDACT